VGRTTTTGGRYYKIWGFRINSSHKGLAYWQELSPPLHCIVLHCIGPAGVALLVDATRDDLAKKYIYFLPDPPPLAGLVYILNFP
jgi:hypothetical protein